MLPKQHRLNLSKQENQLIFKNSTKFYCDFFSAFYKKDCNKSKFNVTVSKKLFKQAVKRNQLRRIYYSLLHELGFSELQIKLIIVLKNKNFDKDLIKQELIKLKQKINANIN